MKDAHIISLRYKMDGIKEQIEGKIIGLKPGGYGFISTLEIPFERIFFHWTGLKQETKRFMQLNVNDKVKFTPVKNEIRGWRAVNIEVI
jgi:cold shock CspA family protein